MDVTKQELLLEDGKTEPAETKSLWYHAYTVWLFTRSDLKTIVLPATVFGMASVLSGPLLTTNASPDYYSIICRLPLVLLGVWMDLLAFNISNQRQPGSVIEDAANKPWRALPSGRISEEGARRLLLALIPTCIAKSLLLGGTLETMVLFILTWLYNDLHAADSHYLLRNALNALGICAHCAGAGAFASSSLPSTPHHLYTIASLTHAAPLTPRYYAWLLLLASTVFVTISLQDLPDVEGDAAKGRLTQPLVAGEVARAVRSGALARLGGSR
ncbi:hypothetical protein SLS57_005366 [Botryosphaeria dothidea]